MSIARLKTKISSRERDLGGATRYRNFACYIVIWCRLYKKKDNLTGIENNNQFIVRSLNSKIIFSVKNTEILNQFSNNKNVPV